MFNDKPFSLVRAPYDLRTADAPAGGGGGSSFVEMSQLLPEEAELVKQLRAEANDEKEEFGNHAFQALGIASVALGGIVYLMFYNSNDLAVALASVPILAFALMTCQLGDSCYSTANRHYGYELYLYRIRTIYPSAQGRWDPRYRQIEWEAAMRAWRVVQATLFEAIYIPGRNLSSDRFRRGFNPDERPLWFCQESLGKESGASWHAGAYLRRMHRMLLLVATASVIILYVAAFALFLKSSPLSSDSTNAAGKSSTVVFAVNYPEVVVSLPAGLPDLSLHWPRLGVWPESQLCPLPEGKTPGKDALCFVDAAHLDGVLSEMYLAFAAIATFVLIARARAENARRKIMEDGLLSIHASAIVWQAVVVAHFNALRRARECGKTSWELVEIAQTIRRSRKFRTEYENWRNGSLKFEQLIPLVNVPGSRGGEKDGAGQIGYTFWLSEEASSLARRAIDVPGWVGMGEDGPHAS